MLSKAAIDVDSREAIATYVSSVRSILNALAFLRKVLKICEDKPLIVVNKGPWHPCELKRLGIEYFGDRNMVQRWSGIRRRGLRDSTKTQGLLRL